MSKRKVRFDDSVDVQQLEDNEDKEAIDGSGVCDGELLSKTTFGKKFKHTLDSDEEDDELNAQNYNVLDCDHISGQEEATVEFEGDVRITPFNMDEELEEGHFDKDGNYIFHKSEEIHDNWLDRIDWVGVQQNSEQLIKKSNKSNDNNDENESDEESQHFVDFDYNSVYQQMIALMEPKESVQKAIQRLGKSCAKTKTINRWKNKNNETNNDQSDNEIISKENLLKLSSLADKVLQTGDMDIYQKTYEQLNFHLNKKSNVDSVDSDMFSDNFDSTKKMGSNDEIKSNIKSNNDINWEFKWEDKETAQVFGPHTSQQMLNWVNEGYFENGVYVRQIGKTDSQFYSSKRIDFDLYS